MTEPRYPYVVVDVTPSEAEEASAGLFDLGAQGVEERDPTTLSRSKGADTVTLIASFEDHDGATAALTELAKSHRAWLPRVEEVIGDAWRDEWKKHFEPFRICEHIVVVPPWREYTPAPGERVLVLEPGRAFGTGLHETTRLVAEILAERAASFAGRAILDVGCGSGILSLVALLLGASSTRSIDVDPDATAVTRENAERNGLSTRLVADETRAGAVAGRYPMVVANIEAGALTTLAPDLVARVAQGGTLVLSGVLAPEVDPAQLDALRRAYAALTLEETRQKGEWIALVLTAQS